MEINPELVQKILSCNLLGRCGCIDDLGFPVKYVKIDEVKKMKRLNWGNLNLDVRGDFTSFLCVNYREMFNQWNPLVHMLKGKYIKDIEAVIRNNWTNEELLKSVIDDVKFNIITIIMYDAYSEYYHEEYFEKMLKIYLSGHLPCGWSGNYPEGVFKVY